ncbi:chromatin assembly factor 1 subunit A-like [Sitodiplosis mosellana]|uniref:chromatin assembly factor 1 subunit A-like n=1 Tax=Sitodiplosis mosellana TaxID=263140 RepID=UPI0024452A58|nr:chromatin assembly factor 1 subunit A-like [Sitodiplosis mosellana]XP_055309207.1 chromatin assembly factor 1 subunit A-like [Sitodiplosis mosellana]
MKSSPKLNEMPPSTGSKTPASGKKLVQARLPFKTLGGSEPPANETSDTTLATANTLTPVTDNRKRKQSTSAAKDDGFRAAKINRRELDSNDSVVVLETTEAMESDLSADSETGNGTKTMLSRNSESKENCKEAVEKVENANCAPKAKHSLEFDEERPEPRKSKRNDSSFTIKLPMSKKTKKTKKHKTSEPSDPTKNEIPMEEDNLQDTIMDVDTIEDTDVDANVDAGANSASTTTSLVQDVDELSDNEDSNNFGDKSLLNDSITSNTSDRCLTPAKMTPRQLQRRHESEKKKQEKEQAKVERERKLQEEKEQRQREKEERELQKKREREEKDEQRKKEKEMREQKLLEEKLEKQREKEQKEHQRKIEQEQRKREKEERELQKKKEREDKEREKEEERKKREDEKRQKIEAEQNKHRKTAEAFVKFFVPKKVENKCESNENDEKMDLYQVSQMFMSFQVKEDMKMAPVTRRTLNGTERSTLEQSLTSNNSSVNLYLAQIKSDAFVAKKTARTWQDDEDDKCSNADDLFIIEEDGQGVQLIKEEPKKLYRAKFFKFAENRRPPYYGTWRKKSATVRARKPFGLDSRLDYEVDSDDEWEEEEPGESLHGSDDEKEVESEDEYEIDNEFFVPHGHLSDEELQNEDEPDFNDPENLKFKLKLAQNEFEHERKKKTQKLKPRLIGLIWQNSNGLKPDNCSNGVWELMNKHALLFNEPTVKVERPTNQTENSDDENTNTKPLGVRRLQIGEKEIPDLIRLINGNQNSSKFLVKEFCAFLAKNHQPHREYASSSIMAKIKELAAWQSCPEEDCCMYRKMCWYVRVETRKRYNVNDLTFPNTWSYTIPPRRPVGMNEVEGESKATENNEVEKKTDLADIIEVSDDSNSCTLSETLTPELIKQASSKRQNYNIAKFIRPLTLDEKKKQFEPITLNRRPSEDQMTEKDTNEAPSAKSSSQASAPKKRLNILMSGPVGQELSPKLKTTLVTQFLSNNVRKRKSTDVNSDVTETSSTSTAGTSDGAKKTKLNDSVIVID